MENSKLVKVAKNGIKAEISQIRQEYGVNISQIVGRVIGNFVRYWKNKPQNTEGLYEQFCELNSMLERTLSRYEIGESFSLHEIQKSGLAICKALSERNENDLANLADYLSNLARKN